MLRLAPFVLWISLPLFTIPQSSNGQESSTVLDYLAGRAARMTAELPPVPDTLDAWEKHRAELIAQLDKTLGLPDREPMRAAVTGSTSDADLVIEEIAYLWAGETHVSATVIRSGQAEGRRPAIVIPSGYLGHYTFRPYREFVYSLARQGFVILFIDDPRTGRRHAPYAGLYATASAAGTQVAGIQVFDALRAMDYLLTRTDVDAGRIGIAGLAEGAVQAYLAAALEPRFQFVVAVGGTTTYDVLVRAALGENRPVNPSAYVAGILKFTDMDRVAACLAPRPVLVAGSGGGRWPLRGHLRVLRTMKTVYGLYDAEDCIRKVPGDSSDDMTPYIPEITRWLEDTLDAENAPASIPNASAAATVSSDESSAELSFSMLHFMQQRIAHLTASLPVEPQSNDQWQAYREELIQWLRAEFGLEGLKPAADEVVNVSESDGCVVEQLALGIDEDFRCPALLVHPTESTDAKQSAVILSHNDRQCAASAKIVEAARQLASAGYWVIVPDHASVHQQSLQGLADAEQPSFYGDAAARFYGPADAVGISPLALRVADNIAAFRYLAGRPELDSAKIVIVGLGTGGVDACLTALLEEDLAGVAAINVTTVRDWAMNVAPDEIHFFHIMPYLPSLLSHTDLDLLYGAVAPRPLLTVRLKDGWPRSGFEQVAATVTAIYELQQAGDALQILGPRDVTEQLEAAASESIQKQLIAVARTLVPAPPQPGIVGNVDGLRSRKTADSAAGLIWIVAEMDGYDQEFVDEGYRLQSWSFFNDNGEAQKGRLITPVILKREGDKYELVGVGTTRSNTGTGVQMFDFESVNGTDAVGEGTFFGWHTGDLEGHTNPGVVEFEDAIDARMIILTADGQMTDQKLQVGRTFRIQSQFPRRYSIMAVSEKP